MVAVAIFACANGAPRKLY